MRKRYLVLSILGGVALLLLILLSVLLGLAMDRTSATAKPPKADFPSMISGMRKLNRQMSRITRAPYGTETQLTFSEAEFNAISNSIFGNTFAAALLGGNTARPLLPQKLLNTRLELKNGIFRLIYTYDTGKNTPFGRYLNLNCRFNAQVENGTLQLKILSCDAGAFPVPDGLAQHYADRLLEQKFKGSPMEKILSEGVIQLRTEEEKLILRYRPQELVDAADKACFGSANNKIRRFLDHYGR